MTKAICFLVLLTLGITNAQNTYKVCASESKSSECQALERGDSRVICEKVTDSVDCLVRIGDGTADFAALTAEEVILAATTKPGAFDVLASIKYEEKKNHKFAFQSVALVKKTHTGGLPGLKGGKLCHPGYGKAKEQLWSDRVLKYFEKKTASNLSKCNAASQSSAEDDINNLSSFFTEACRPGPWVLDPIEDKRLKDKFPALCTLCTSNRNPDCDGYRYYEPRPITGEAVNSHLSAIECLVSTKGTVAYVAYQHVQEYFQKNTTEMSDYALLCENGTTVELTNREEAPCAWISQPWGALLARKEKSAALKKDILTWMPTGRSDSSEIWIDSLDAILFKDKTENLEYPRQIQSLTEYISVGRPIPAIAREPCHKALRWCTIGDQEQNKCTWVQNAAQTVGLQPEIYCVQAVSPIDCMSMIKQDRADFISIDSNFGFLGRKYYNITAVLYDETSKTMASKVYAVIKDTSKDSIKRFENLRGKNACFPEYGGIGWVAFMKTAHERRVISSNECDYANEVANFFGGACSPGAADPAHFPSKAANPTKLCSVCSEVSNPGTNEQGIVSQNTLPSQPQMCPADPTNKFYGNKGALACLAQTDADVAFIEGQNLKRHARMLRLKPEDFRVLCKNNSLANYPGFDVDDNCALSVTIDSEVVARRGDKNTLNLQLLLQDIDNWFGYATGSYKLIDMKVFSPFNKTKDLLFKDSTVGLVTKRTENELVVNYIELFKHTESCTGGATSVLSISLFTLLSILLLQVISQKVIM